MAPFQYEQYRNPFVGSIGELMMQPARAQAQAELQKGAVWSNAADRIAQAVGSIPAQMQQHQEQQQRAELVGGQLADARARRAGNTAVDTLMQGDQLPANDAGPRQESYTDANGLFDVPKLNQALAHMGLGHMAPELLKGAESINESITNHQALEQKTAQAKTLIFGDMADGALKLAKLGMPVADAMDFVVQPGIATGRIAPQEYAQLRQQIARLPPEQQAAALTTFMDSASKIGGGETLGKDAQRLDRYGRVVATNAVEEPGKGDYTINGQRFSADGKPKGPVVPKENEPPKAGSSEDWVSRARRLAVAKNGGVALSDQQQLAVDSAALQTYKENNADPVLRDAAIAQKNMALALAKMQEGLMPTKEQAADVAGDLVNHRMAPEQLATLFSTRGKEGLAFKLAVQAEARKMEPNFNWEEASAEYTLAKSTGFQNTVRLMDSVQESMPRLLANARKLGNGDWRSWNQLANAAKGQFNDVDLKRLKTDALLVGDEVAKILAGGGTGSATSDAKLKQGVDLMNTSDSVPAIAATLDEIQTLIGFRRRSMTRGTYMEGTAAVRPASDQVSMIEAFDADGKIHHAPAGTALPAGWKLKK